MNFRSSLHQYSAIVLVLLVLANGVHSFSISNEKDDKSNKSNQENSAENANDDANKYNYNLTDAELLRTNEQVDFYDFEQMERNCCFLARLAAQRGFRCNLKFYSHKLLYRIRNRTHRKHIQIIGNSREHMMNQQLMLKFGKCLNGFASVFELCCWDEVDRELDQEY